VRDICVGYLDHTDQISVPMVADKARTLTKLSVTKHLQAPRCFEATNIDDILLWFTSEYRSRYLVVIKYGVVLNDFKIVKDAIDDLVRTNTAVKGRVEQKDGSWYLDDSFVIIDRVQYESLGYPSWGLENKTQAAIRAQLCTADDKAFLLETHYYEVKDVIRSKGGGWNLINRSIRSNKPIQAFTMVDDVCLHYMDPHSSTIELAGALCSNTPMASSELTQNQSWFLLNYAPTETLLGRSVEVFDTEVYRPWCGETQIEIRNLYTLASGFKPLRILQHHGFRDDTTVTYFDVSGQAIEFRKTMIDQWDGVDFPAFLHRINSTRSFTLLIGPHPENAWQDVLKTFGGPREFKVLWDRYRRLPHVYRTVNVFEYPELVTTGIRSDPQSYMWFSDVFCTVEAHLIKDPHELDHQFMKFYKGIREANPVMILDGRYPSGRFV
jgi:hypothetical protein